MTDRQASTPYTELLRQLPEYQPPGHLWTSILEARLVQQQRTLRRRSALAGSALAACLVLAVVIAGLRKWRRPGST